MNNSDLCSVLNCSTFMNKDVQANIKNALTGSGLEVDITTPNVIRIVDPLDGNSVRFEIMNALSSYISTLIVFQCESLKMCRITYKSKNKVQLQFKNKVQLQLPNDTVLNIRITKSGEPNIELDDQVYLSTELIRLGIPATVDTFISILKIYIKYYKNATPISTIFCKQGNDIDINERLYNFIDVIS